MNNAQEQVRANPSRPSGYGSSDSKRVSLLTLWNQFRRGFLEAASVITGRYGCRTE